MKPRLIEAYMDIAERFAQVSECQRLKVGAIIVKNGSILAHGWNGTPSGFRTNVCELEDGTTSPFVLHAEQNVLVKMAKSTESIEGAGKLFSPPRRKSLRALCFLSLEK